MRARPGEVEQVVRARPQHAPDRLVGQRRLGEHRLAVAALEVLERRLLVAAHVRLEDRPLRLHRRALHHVAHVQHVASCGSSCSRPTASPVVQRQRTWHIGPTTCVLTSRSRAKLRQRRVVSRSASQSCIAESSSAIQRASSTAVRRRVADEAGRARDPVARGRRCGTRPTRRRPARRAAATPRARPRCARAGRRRNRARATGLDHGAVRLPQLVLAELELDRPDDRHRDHGDAGQHLLRLRERLEVDPGHLAVQPERLLPGPDRGGVVLARPLARLHRARA